jgi:hypothetical protein
MTEKWMPIAEGFDREGVKARARATLAEFGQDLDKLSPEQVRVDAGTDTQGRRWFRVQVVEAVIGKSGSVE